jgi:DNA-binding CsgD family transcriptional regulator
VNDSVDVIAEIYDAVGDAERWTQLLHRLSGPLDADVRTHLDIARIAHERHVAVAADVAVLSAIHSQLGFGAVIVDEQSRVLQVNHLAARLLDEEGGLRLVDHCLQAIEPEETQHLHGAIAGAASNDPPRPPFLIFKRSGRSPLTVFVLCAQTAARRFVEIGRPVLLLTIDPDRMEPPGPRVLAALFGFTPREAECAALLMHGHGIDDAARIMGVSRSTARTFVARLTAKTDSHSQSELVSRLLSVPHVRVE